MGSRLDRCTAARIASIPVPIPIAIPRPQPELPFGQQSLMHGLRTQSKLFHFQVGSQPGRDYSHGAVAFLQFGRQIDKVGDQPATSRLGAAAFHRPGVLRHGRRVVECQFRAGGNVPHRPQGASIGEPEVRITTVIYVPLRRPSQRVGLRPDLDAVLLITGVSGLVKRDDPSAKP